MVVAAECWASDLDELPARLAHELELLRDVAERETAQAAWDQWRAAHRDENDAWNKALVRSLLDPGMQELGSRLSMTPAERAAEARRPRPGDRPPQPIHNSLTTSQSGEAA